jgi:SAM-dependent methyltransferase
VSEQSAPAYFNPDYFVWQAASAERSAQVIVSLLIELLHPAAVADVGCGTGAWLQVFQEHGVRQVQIDGSYIDVGQLRIPRESFRACDLSGSIRIESSFDLVLSLEVAHYLPPEHAAQFVRTLTELAPIVLFSAAVPHQSGGPGLNRQWPRYWCDLFRRHGFRGFDWLRPRVWEDERVDWWYAQNAVLFVREGHMDPVLGDPGPVLPLVHPRFLLHCMENPPTASTGPGHVIRRAVEVATRARRERPR